MEENLVGYLLKACDDETQQQVEAALHQSPELRARLDLLERALTPLAADKESPPPRPDLRLSPLALSTLARIAEHQCRKLPDAPPAPPEPAPISRPWLRRPDALVAALLLIVLGGIGSSFLLRLWRDYNDRAACQNNMQQIWKGLKTYCDVHNGNYPLVEEKGAHGVAAIYVPALFDNGLLGSEVSVNCPAQRLPKPERRSLEEMDELYEKDVKAFRHTARQLAGGYAYSLGYRDSSGYHGLRCDSGDRLPILADRLETPLLERNSANHGGDGQNVLYLGGHVQWHTNRNAGVAGDDIYVNWDNQVLAGKAREDTVLAPGDASPTPPE
jgi:hypothetical protein